jgi:hypothetical protein
MFALSTRSLRGASAMIMAGVLGVRPLPLCAQRLAELPSSRAYEAAFREEGIHLPDSRELLGVSASPEGRRTYWLAGGIVGGLALGALGYELGSACPANTGSCPRRAVGFLIGASVGFVIGAFVGDTIEKPQE